MTSVPLEGDGLSALTAIFGFVEKAKLVKHCKSAVVHQSHLADLIRACRAGVLPLQHFPFYRHHHPVHLVLSDAERSALATAGLGAFEGAALKAAKKTFQMFDERRLLNAHFFYVSESAQWHLIYFDDKDASDDHWEHGSHIHLMNWLTHPQLKPLELFDQLASAERPKLGGALHIRYDRGD